MASGSSKKKQTQKMANKKKPNAQKMANKKKGTLPGTQSKRY